MFFMRSSWKIRQIFFSDFSVYAVHTLQAEPILEILRRAGKVRVVARADRNCVKYRACHFPETYDRIFPFIT